MVLNEVDKENRVVKDFVDTAQFRELERRLSSVTDTVNTLSAAYPTETADITPPLVNFVDNSDFDRSESTYNSAGWADAANVLANWFGRLQSETDSWENNTGAEATHDSIRRSTHGSGLRTGYVWNASEGSIALTGGYRIGSKLTAKYACAGNYMVVRFQLSRVSGKAAPATDIIGKVSIWDNSDNRIIRGTKPVLATAKTGAGAVTRDYILEVVMPDGRTFYSDTAAFVAGQNQATLTPAVTSVSSTQFVTISWATPIIGSARYNVYRRTPAEADTNWYLIGSITNGSTTTIDYGGTGGGQWIVPSFDLDHKEYQLAEALYPDIGAIIQTEDDIQEISMGINIPSVFSPNGDQYVQIEFLKADGTNSTTTEIAADSIRVDRIGVSYTNGRWCPSPNDTQKAQSITPNPPPTGGGDGVNPIGGSGDPTCVWDESLILAWRDNLQHVWVPAHSVVVGDKLVSWDYTKKTLAPTTVKRIIKGSCNVSCILHTDTNALGTSLSHRVIQDMDDFTRGTSVKTLESETIMGYSQFSNCPVPVNVSKEFMHVFRRVRTFILDKGRENFIAEGMFNHNFKGEVLA